MEQTLTLLEQCLENGDLGAEALYSWFEGNRGKIGQTIATLNEQRRQGVSAEARAVIAAMPHPKARNRLLRAFNPVNDAGRWLVYQGQPVRYCDVTTLERVAAKEILVDRFGDQAIAALAEALKAFRAEQS